MRRSFALLLTLIVLLSLAVTPILAQAPDRDADGVADADDQCPDLQGGGAADGCINGPDFDTDSDGVTDGSDLCPMTFAEGGGQNGCPPEVFAPSVENGQGGGGGYSAQGAYGYGYGYGYDPYWYGGHYYPGSDCAGSLPTRLTVNGRGRIAQRFSTLRYQPAGYPIERVYSPAEFTVVDGPYCGGYGPLTWYYIRYDNGWEGWASESQRWSIWGYNQYWLEPIS
ncbi:MAG: hypothetical protein K8L99_29350 [Anaerolineae bacterium]|nr:hypothetical protein [Anaerolineae bacterium]